jgi:hypothetical protein
MYVTRSEFGAWGLDIVAVVCDYRVIEPRR